MASAVLSRVSAVVLLVAGLVLLFAPDVALPALVPGFPPAAAWLGQLLAAAWLSVAVLNWLQRSSMLGGIYGRPMVVANLTLYLISTWFASSAGQSRCVSPVVAGGSHWWSAGRGVWRAFALGTV